MIDSDGDLFYNPPMSKVDCREWFIINCKPKQEFVVEKNLKAQNITVYLPVYAKKVKRLREKKVISAPLFTGYLFAQFDIQDSYQNVRYTKGVKSVLGNNEYLWTIADEKIADIKSREENGVVVLHRKEEHFQKGDKILIEEGAFEGWEGIFQEELQDRQRVIILLTNVTYSSKMIVEKKFLRKEA